MIVKADFHAHTSADPVDDISYSPYEYIDAAAKKGYKVVALTHHYAQNFDKKYAEYGKKKGVLVIPGLEATIEGQDVVILNSVAKSITSWDALAKEKKKNQCLTILAHPFWYPKNLIWPKKLHKYQHLFDAVEISWLQTNIIRLPNYLARNYAKKYNKPIVGTGDIHDLSWIGSTYSHIKVKKITIPEVFKAIKRKEVYPVQNNISNRFFLKLAIKHILGGVIPRKNLYK